MGVLRLLLALLVVVGHSQKIPQFNMAAPVMAVQIFFMISGFYMSLILAEKYRGAGSTRAFLGNRALRIYPVYWAVVLGAVLFWTAHGVWKGYWGPVGALVDFPISTVVVLVVTNLLIVGSDGLLFSRVDAGGGWHFTSNFWGDPHPLWKGCIDPPAWTLSLELVFYLMAPFLLRRRTPWLVGIVLLSLGCRWWLMGAFGWRADPWNYRFFPSELAFFLAGAIAQRAYARHKQGIARLRGKRVLGAAFFGAIFAFQFVPYVRVRGATTAMEWGIYAFAFVAIPVLFFLSKNSKRDRWVGELSYPVYICHWPLLVIADPLLSKRVGNPVLQLGVLVVLVLGASWVLTRFVAGPVDRLREKRAARMKAEAAAALARAEGEICATGVSVGAGG